MPQLLGYRKFAGKKDATKTYCVATFASELTDKERQNGYVGLKVEEVFMPDTLVDFLKPEHLGRDCRLDYSISNGRAYLDSVTVLDKK